MENEEVIVKIWGTLGWEDRAGGSLWGDKSILCLHYGGGQMYLNLS